MDETHQQAYDRGTSIFSPDGRLYQVEYAREAVKRGTASVGVETSEGIVLAADRRIQSPLIKSDSVEKIHAVDEHVAVASSGNIADTQKLVDFCRVEAQKNRHELGKPMDVEGMTKHLTDHIQEYTQTGGARPFGASLLVGGISDGKPRLFAVDPSGASYEWYATAIGNASHTARDYLEDVYSEDIGLDVGIDIALEGLAKTTEEMTPDEIDLTVVDADSASVQPVSNSEIESHLAKLDFEN